MGRYWGIEQNISCNCKPSSVGTAGLVGNVGIYGKFLYTKYKSCFFLLEIANHSNETVLVIGYHLPKVGNNRGSEKFNFLSLSF